MLKQQAELKVIKPAAFESGTFDEVKASEIRRLGVRVLFVLAWEEDILAIASAIPGAGWAWIQIDKVGLGANAMQGWLALVPFLRSDLAEAFTEQVSVYTESHFNFSVSQDSVDPAYSAALYEAIMLYAHAATDVMSKAGSLQDGEAVTAAVRNTSFIGVGGTPVKLDSNGDRIQSYEVLNYALGEGDMVHSVAVGLFNSLGQYKAYERAVLWPGKTEDVPSDYFSGRALMARSPELMTP